MLVVWFLCLPWVLSAAKKCIVNQNVKVSQALDSLDCYTDYKSYLHCKWREEPELLSNRRLQLRFERKDKIEACRDYPSDIEGIRECRFETRVFSPKTIYKALFNDTLELCSSIQHTPQVLSQLLRALEPVNLTTSATDGRGRLITWSSPYPQSSALNDDITYEVNYRQHGQNEWTVVVQPNKQMKLDEKLILGRDYEVRVRARIKQSQWSNWSPTVSWYTPHDLKQAPRVDCVLWGEQEARCSWEQSIEQGHFISYQLVCRHNHTATSHECCKNPTMTREQKKVRFSCLLPLTKSTPLIQLIPTQNVKDFRVMKHIRPYPPTKVNVTQRGNIWVVDWTPAGIKDAKLTHEVRYYSRQDEKDAVNLPSNDSSINILGSSLTPSRRYWVKVRSMVLPPYNGPPSDWSPSIAWTPHAATWPNWIYASVALLVAGLFIVVFIVPACRRRVVLWVESIPSPNKSKVILDLKTVRTHPAKASEETYLCKVIDMDSMSTCSTIMSLWPLKRLNTQTEEVEADDEGVWSCDNIPVFPLDKSSMSFSGPYIFCQSIESKPMEEDSSHQTEVFCAVVGCPVDMMTAQSEEGYVRLPGPTVSTSVQDLSSQSHSTDEQSSSSREEAQHCLSMDYASEAFWPQGGTVQGSGYCQLPANCTQTEPG